MSMHRMKLEKRHRVNAGPWVGLRPPSIDLLYDIEQIINPSRLTNALDQFG